MLIERQELSPVQERKKSRGSFVPINSRANSKRFNVTMKPSAGLFTVFIIDRIEKPFP